MSARIAEEAALSLSSFRKRYRSYYETQSPSSSLTLLVRKRYRERDQCLDDEGQGLDDECQGLEDEGLGMEEEEAAPEGQEQAILVVDIVANEPLSLGYEVARCHALETTEDITPSTYEVDPEDGRVYTNIPTYVPLTAPVQTPPSPKWSLGSLLVSPSSSVVPSPIASPVANLATTISVDEDQILEVYDKDLRKLYTRSGVFRDEIFSQRYRFRSLEQEQERAMVMFSAIWRTILALEAWPAQTDA
ncbi:hypothetical protein Tco_1356121 [Tanacetum coccineum]